MAAPERFAKRQIRLLHRGRRPYMARRPFKVVAIALANKMARIAWALLASGGIYRAPRLAAA